MPWKIKSAIGERWRLIRALLRNEESLSHWGRVFGISRKTAYKWQARFTHGGRRALRDRWRRPQRQPRQLHGRWRDRIGRVRRQHRHWGPKKIQAWFQSHGGVSPSQRSIARMLRRLHLVRKVWQHTHKAGVIRVDNGGPFGSKGAAGLSRLSVWWMRLGIQVEFIRRGHPEDNGAHEQFHRVMKRETTSPAARTRRGQQQRTTVWLADYNTVRQHEGLGQKRPSQMYQRSPRRYPERLPELRYAARWAVRRVRSNGQIKWRGRVRFVGEAFVGQNLGLRTIRAGVQAVYFDKLLIGHLHQRDPGGMRPMVYRHRGVPFKKCKV